MATETAVPLGEEAPVLEVMATMRAIRRLKPDPVPRELLERLIEAATWAPSGSNTQEYSFVVVTEREQFQRLAPIWRRIADWYVATQAAPPHLDETKWERMLDALRYQAEHFEQTPALIVCCYELSGMVKRMLRAPGRTLAGARRLGPRAALVHTLNTPKAFVRGEAACIYPCVQNLLLAARANGLGATLTTWHLWFEGEFKEVLGIPRGIHTYAVVPVGWPRGKLGPVSRRPAAEAIRWERW